ncbi:MAG: hypothetical protein R3356_09820, partial [Eudoraea sp.]|nr:hypothetical protein [Eudoraea sp.]
IQFTDDGQVQADIIIEQHAPYAGSESVDVPGEEADLLELDEGPEDAFEIITDEEAVEEEAVEEEAVEEENADEELTSENLIGAMVKEDADMEEPGTESQDIPPVEVEAPKQEKNNNNQLIKNFILEEPGVIRADTETQLKGDVSLSSIREHDGFITDTLAKIYVKQGLYAKAIYAYEKLSLKYPEKSAYFAAQIEKIRNINHS